MKLISIHIEDFGCLHNFDLKLEEGLTVIREDNGFGKSTLAEFIRAMFYGFPRAAKSLDKNKRKKYLPWNGGKCGGYLIFALGEECYRLERTFGTTPKADFFRLIDLRTNRTSDRFSEDIGLELFGLDGDSFERSTYFPQLHDQGKLSTDSIRAKLGDLVEDANDVGNFEKAVTALRNKRSGYVPYRGRGGSVAQAVEQISCLQEEATRLEAGKAELDAAYLEADRLTEQLKRDNLELEKIREEITRNSQAVAANTVHQQYENLLTAYRQVCSGLDQRFADCALSEAVFAEAEQMCEAYQTARLAIGSLPQEEAARLWQLESFFARELPDEAMLEDLTRCHRQIQQMTMMEENKKGSEEEQKQLQELSAFFGGDCPGDVGAYEEKMARVTAIWQESDGYRERLKNALKLQKRSFVAYAGMVLALLMAVVGGVCLIGQNLAAMGVALLGVGILLLAVCLIPVLRWLGSVKPGTLRRLIRECDETKEQLYHEVEAFVRRYVPVGDLAAGLEQIREKQMHLQNLEEKNTVFARECQEIAVHRRNAEKMLADRMTLWYEAGVDFERALLDLRIKRNSLLELRAKGTRVLENSRKQKLQADALEKQLDAFLGIYYETVDPGAYRNLLNRLRREWDEDNRSRNRVVELKNQLDAFRAQYGSMLERPVAVVDMELLKDRERKLVGAVDSRNAARQEMQQRIRRIQAAMEEIPRIQGEITCWQEKKQKAQQNARILDCTMEFLQQARDSLAGNYLVPIQRSFGALMERMTGEGREKILVTGDLEVFLERRGQARELASFSAGQADLVMLCMRMALVDALFRGEKPFVVLDDPFVNLDDTRTEQAMALLRELAEDRQILYLTCNSSRT